MLAAVLGEYGDGKTLFLTCLSVLSRLYNKPVYSNYGLYSLNHARIEILDDLDAVKDGTVVLDEWWYSIDSRTATSRENKFASVVLSKSRKRNLTIAYSEQGFDLVDKRFRERTRIIFLPTLDRPKNPRWLSVEIYKRNKAGLFERMPRSLLFSVEKILALYDTNEELQPLKLENR